MALGRERALPRARMLMPTTPAAVGATGRAAAVPGNWLALGLAASLCLALWTTSARLLVASEAREGGRVLACRYFTGAGVAERQYATTGRGADVRACPLVRVG